VPFGQADITVLDLSSQSGDVGLPAVLVTGGARRIGAAIARRFGEAAGTW
jgi:hypothetical protein